MSWEQYTKTTTKTAESDFGDERASVPDGTYHAVCVRVGEPYDKANSVSGEMQTKFVAEFELSGKRLRGKTATLPTFIAFPPKYLEPKSYLSEKSNLHKIMKAMGCDMDVEEIDVNPPSWVDDALACDVVVENQPSKQPEGGDVSWITKFLKCGCDEDELPKAKKVPVAAGRRSRASDWDEDESA